MLTAARLHRQSSLPARVSWPGAGADGASPEQQTVGRRRVLARYAARLAGALTVCCLSGAASATTLFSFTGSLQTWAVPATGDYDIIAWGAQGGTAGAALPGYGAEIGGVIPLTAGQVLDIVVGGEGLALGNGGGGGGGSIIYLSGTDPLVVAGGGGGAYVTGLFAGQDGQISTGNGQGGAAGCGGGGAGFYSGGSVACPGDSGGASFPSWAGGTGEFGNAGGYGGGGGGYGSGGGGGGYTGGVGGTGTNAAGGGGSFLIDTATDPIELAGVQHGDGQVTISPEGDPAPAPEPASGVVLGLGAACLALLRRRSGQARSAGAV